jgi:hypothetical protein
LKPCYLVDPWLLDLKPEDSTELRFSRLTSLKKLKELQGKYGMSPVKFVDDEFRKSLLNNHHNFQRREWEEVGKLLASATFREAPHGQSVGIVDRPCPTLSAQWLSALGKNGCDDSSSNWRRPIIVLPEVRSSSWPNSADKGRELKFIISGRADPTMRNLVCIERYDQHTYFEPDLDPWRIGAIGMPAEKVTGNVGERREANRRLPRPMDLLPLKLTFTQIWEKLQRRLDWSCEHEGRAYFIPREEWDPRDISREIWRNGNNIFKTDKVQDGRRGPVDREGRVWLWDWEKNSHWDVQLPDRSHRNISPDGEIL